MGIPPGSRGGPRLRSFTPQQWGVISACFVLLGLFFGFNFMFGIFIKPLIAEFGWTVSATSAAYTIYMAMVAVCGVLVGGLADRYGARPVILAGILLAGGSVALAGSIQNLWQFYLLMGVLAGLGRSALQTPVSAYLQRAFTANRGLATGLAGSGSGMGLIFFSPLAGYLIASHGWRWAYLFLGLLFIVLAVPVTLLLRPAAERREEAPGPGKTRAAYEPPDALLPEASLGMGEIVKRRPFWAILGSHTADCLCHSVLILHIVPMAIEAGMNPVQAASLAGVMGAGQFVGRVLIGVLSDRIGAKRSLLTALLLQTLPVPLLWGSPTLPAFFVVAAMVGLGLGGHGTMYPLVTREYYGPKRVGLLFGTFTSGASVGMALGGLMGGLLYDLSGNYSLAIGFSFAMGVVSLLFVLLYPGRRAQAAPAPARAAQPAG